MSKYQNNDRVLIISCHTVYKYKLFKFISNVGRFLIEWIQFQIQSVLNLRHWQ